MPYIKEQDRIELGATQPRCPDTPGELNYLFSSIANIYWRAHRNYQGINDIIGALEGAKLEFYRRVAAPYEDLKIKENGDVY